MAERLNKSNKIRAEDLTSGINGNLSEIPPEALFQTLNMNNKTGILTISDLSKGTARFSFRQGALIKAKYDEYAGDMAFYQILKEHIRAFPFHSGHRSGRFQHPGDRLFHEIADGRDAQIGRGEKSENQLMQLGRVDLVYSVPDRAAI